MEGKKKVYQLSVKKDEDDIYNVYLGALKLDFRLRRNPDLKDEDVSENDALDLAARFIVKMARSFVQSHNRKNAEKKD